MKAKKITAVLLALTIAAACLYTGLIATATPADGYDYIADPDGRVISSFTSTTTATVTSTAYRVSNGDSGTQMRPHYDTFQLRPVVSIENAVNPAIYFELDINDTALIEKHADGYFRIAVGSSYTAVNRYWVTSGLKAGVSTFILPIYRTKSFTINRLATTDEGITYYMPSNADATGNSISYFTIESFFPNDSGLTVKYQNIRVVDMPNAPDAPAEITGTVLGTIPLNNSTVSTILWPPNGVGTGNSGTISISTSAYQNPHFKLQMFISDKTKLMGDSITISLDGGSKYSAYYAYMKNGWNLISLPINTVGMSIARRYTTPEGIQYWVQNNSAGATITKLSTSVNVDIAGLPIGYGECKIVDHDPSADINRILLKKTAMPAPAPASGTIGVIWNYDFNQDNVIDILDLLMFKAGYRLNGTKIS